MSSSRPGTGRPRTATGGPVQRPVPSINVASTPRTVGAEVGSPAVPGAPCSSRTPRAGATSPSQEPEHYRMIVGQNQRMRSELDALRPLVAKLKAERAKSLELQSANDALEAETTQLRNAYDKVQGDLRAEREAHAAARAEAAELRARMEEAERSGRDDSDAAAAEAQQRADDLADELQRTRMQLDAERAAVAAHQENLAVRLEEAAAKAQAALESDVAARQAAHEKELGDVKATHRLELEALRTELAAAVAELAARPPVPQLRRCGTQTHWASCVATGCDARPLPPPPAAGPSAPDTEDAGARRRLQRRDEANSAAFRRLDALYRDYLTVSDDYNKRVNNPMDRAAANAAVLEANESLSRIMAQLGDVEQQGLEDGTAAKTLADVLSNCIVTTTMVQSYVGQGIVLEADLGDEAYTDHEATMMMAVRHAVRQAMRETARRRAAGAASSGRVGSRSQPPAPRRRDGP